MDVGFFASFFLKQRGLTDCSAVGYACARQKHISLLGHPFESSGASEGLTEREERPHMYCALVIHVCLASLVFLVE